MESDVDKLAIMTQPAVSHVVFGWFNLSLPNVVLWVAAIIVFFLFAWVRVPLVMEADAKSRREGQAHEH